MLSKNEAAVEARARRAAARCGLVATKSRWRRDSVDNHGGFMLYDERGIPVSGFRFDLTAEEVLAYCTDE